MGHDSIVPGTSKTCPTSRRRQLFLRRSLVCSFQVTPGYHDGMGNTLRRTESGLIVRLQGVQLLLEEQANPYAPPENSPRIWSLDPDISLRKRLRKIFYIHLASVVVLSGVMQNDGNLLPGGQIGEFLVFFPLGSTFYVCPIATLVAVWSASSATTRLRCLSVVADLALSVLQFLICLPGIQ